MVGSVVVICGNSRYSFMTSKILNRNSVIVDNVAENLTAAITRDIKMRA
jgi:hypothetical protein